MECDAKVDVDLDVFPRARCTEIAHSNASFDVAIEVDHRPECKIRHVRSERLSDCRERCVFRVDVQSDFKCRPEIVSKCPFSRATFDLHIDAATKQKCAIRKEH